MRKFVCNIVVLMCLPLFTIEVSSKNIEEMFVSMPDTIMPYFNSSQRKELVDMKHIDNTDEASLRSVFGTVVSLVNMSEQMIEIRVGDVLYEIGQLYGEQNDTVFCVMITVSLPEKETTARLYNENWECLSYINLATLIEDVADRAEDMIFVEAHFVDNANTLKLKKRIPLLSNDEYDEINSKLPEEFVYWDGKAYKKK